MMQNILLIGAFVLLTTIILSINSIIMSTNKTILENEVQITAIGLAQTLMEEIISRDFDENTTGIQKVRFPIQLTSLSVFGSESSEPSFDDVDDYHNYSTMINTPRIDGYNLNVKVSYADPILPKNDLAIRTFLKRISITIKNQKYMQNPDSLTISSIVGYFK